MSLRDGDKYAIANVSVCFVCLQVHPQPMNECPADPSTFTLPSHPRLCSVFSVMFAHIQRTTLREIIPLNFIRPVLFAAALLA